MIFFLNWMWQVESRTTDTQWKHKSKITENFGRCGRQNMRQLYLKIWDWIFGRAVKAIFYLGVRSPWVELCKLEFVKLCTYKDFLCICYNYEKWITCKNSSKNKTKFHCPSHSFLNHISWEFIQIYINKNNWR